VELGALYRLCVSVCLCGYVYVCLSVSKALFKLNEIAPTDSVSMGTSARSRAAVA